MKTLTRTVTLLFVLFVSHSATSMTVVSSVGNNDGLGLVGLTPADTALLGTSTVASPSSTFLYQDVEFNTGPGDGTNKWRFGSHSFTQVFTILPGQVIQSAFFEISAGGHGLGGSPTTVALDGFHIGNLTQGEGYVPRPATGPVPGYNALFKDTFTFNPGTDFSTLADGVANITIVPSGGNDDGWILDYARLVLNITTPVVTTPPDGTGDENDGVVPGDGGPDPVTPAAPVPVPAAFWLLLSGFVALFRFKKSGLNSQV